MAKKQMPSLKGGKESNTVGKQRVMLITVLVAFGACFFAMQNVSSTSTTQTQRHQVEFPSLSSVDEANEKLDVVREEESTVLFLDSFVEEASKVLRPKRGPKELEGFIETAIDSIRSIYLDHGRALSLNEEGMKRFLEIEENPDYWTELIHPHKALLHLSTASRTNIPLLSQGQHLIYQVAHARKEVILDPPLTCARVDPPQVINYNHKLFSSIRNIFLTL